MAFSLSWVLGLFGASGKKEFLSIEKNTDELYMLIGKSSATDGVFKVYDKVEKTWNNDIYILDMRDRPLSYQKIDIKEQPPESEE
mgnify:CR=1 FL=1